MSGIIQPYVALTFGPIMLFHHIFRIKTTMADRGDNTDVKVGASYLYNSVEGHRSNPVLAVKGSLFIEISFLRSIFFRPLKNTCIRLLIPRWMDLCLVRRQN